MGLNNSNGRRIFVNIKMGKLTVKTQEGVVETYGSLTGTLTGISLTIKTYEGKDYEQLALIIVDGNELYEFQFRFDSGYGRGFCYQILNADLKKPITFSPKYSEKEGKKDYWIFLKQFDKPLTRAFTKENPNGLPPMENVTFKGQSHWDNTKQLQFWREMIDRIRPQLINPSAIQVEANVEDPALSNGSIMDGPVHQFGGESISEPLDDLPF